VVERDGWVLVPSPSIVQFNATLLWDLFWGADGSSALHHRCDGGCIRGLSPTLRGCFGRVWAKMM